MTRLTRRGLAAAGLATAALAAGSPARAQALKLTMAGGSVGGAWSAIGNAIGETIRRESPGAAFSYEPGRDAANVQLVATGRVQLGIAHTQMALRALKGEAPFERAFPNVRALALIDPQAALQFVARAASPVQSLEQVKRERIPLKLAVNLRGTMMAIATEEAFKASGVTFQEIEAFGGRVHYVDYNTALDMMKAGQVDMSVNMLAFPSGQLANATRDMPVRMVGLDKAVIDRMTRDVGTQPIDVPGGTYPFQPATVHTVTGTVALLAATEMPEAQAEAVVAAMLKHFDYLKAAHATMARMAPKDLPVTAPVALHPGAAKAYRAAGLSA
jgi:TRAP transporter TAXI family solute receptor